MGQAPVSGIWVRSRNPVRGTLHDLTNPALYDVDV